MIDMDRRGFISKVTVLGAGAFFAGGSRGEPATRDFTDIDPNFKNREVKLGGLSWCDAFKDPLVLEGAPFRNDDGTRTRFPMALVPKMKRPSKYAAMGKQTAGVSVRFRTNAPRIAFKATFDEFYVNRKMPMAASGFDFYRSGRWVGNSLPPHDLKDGAEWTMSFDGTRDPRGETFQLYLPLQCGIRSLQVGLPEKTTLLSPDPHRYGERPVVFYGSSITNCGNVSRPGLEHGVRVGRILDVATHNLGFSGACMGDLLLAAEIARLNPLALVMEYDHNAPDFEHLSNTHAEFFRTFRKGCPQTPVLMLTSPNPRFGDLSRMRIVRTWLEAKDAGDRQVDFIDSMALFDTCEDPADCLMDGVHQNDIGAEIMAKAIAGRLRRMLGDHAVASMERNRER